MCKLGALSKARLRKVRFSGMFWGGFFQVHLFSRNSCLGPFKTTNSPVLTLIGDFAHCTSTCLYNAPSLQIVEYLFFCHVLLCLPFRAVLESIGLVPSCLRVPRTRPTGCQKTFKNGYFCKQSQNVNRISENRNDIARGGKNDYIIEFFRGRPQGGDNFNSLCQVLQTFYSKRQKHPFLP